MAHGAKCRLHARRTIASRQHRSQAARQISPAESVRFLSQNRSTAFLGGPSPGGLCPRHRAAATAVPRGAADLSRVLFLDRARWRVMCAIPASRRRHIYSLDRPQSPHCQQPSVRSRLDCARGCPLRMPSVLTSQRRQRSPNTLRLFYIGDALQDAGVASELAAFARDCPHIL